MDGYLPKRPKHLEGMAVNLPPPRSIPDARQSLGTVTQEKPARWMFKPQLRARKFEMDKEAHRANMAANERERAGKIAIQKISGGLAWMNDNKSPRFGDPTVLNDIFKNSKEAQAFIGGGFHATPTEKTHEGNKIYSIRIFNPQTNEDIITRKQTAKDLINWFDGQLLPEYRAELRSKVAANNKERARIQEAIESNPGIAEKIANGISLSDIEKNALGRGDISEDTVKQLILEADELREAEEAEVIKKRKREKAIHDKNMAVAKKKLEAGEKLTAAQIASYSQTQSKDMEKFDEDYDFEYPLSEKIQKDPEKLTAYNADKFVSKNTELNRRDTENLPEELAQKRSKRRAVKILVDDATGQLVYENADGEQFTNEGCTKPYKETAKEPIKAKEKPTKKKKTSSKKRGYDYSKGFTPQVKQAKKAITKTARGALDFINRPMTEKDRRKLPRYSRQGLGQR